MVIWSPGSSLLFPLNIGIFDGSLVATGGKVGLYLIRSFVNLVKFGRLSVAKNRSRGGPLEFHPDWVGFPKVGKELPRF